MFRNTLYKTSGHHRDPENLPEKMQLIFSIIHIVVLTLYAIVFIYLASTTTSKSCLGFIFVQMILTFSAEMIETVVLMSDNLSYEVDNDGFYLGQVQNLLNLLSTWIYVYHILRVGLLMPVYLNFSQYNLYKF